MYYRVITEWSFMTHNDEHVSYVDLPEDTEIQFTQEFRERAARLFKDPNVVLQRPVFPEEKLDMRYKGDKNEEDVTDITLALDAYYTFQKEFSFWVDLQEKTKCDRIPPHEVLSMYIANSYYDCMSGGMPLYSMVLTYLLLTYCTKEQLQYHVYPGKELPKGQEKKNTPYEDWYTLEDFKNTCEKDQDIQKHINVAKSILTGRREQDFRLLVASSEDESEDRK